MEDNVIPIRPTIVGICPKCGRNVVERKEKYSCEGYTLHDDKNTPLCDFSIWKDFRGAKITSKVIKEILEKGKTENKVNFMTKEGEVYQDYILLDLNENTNLSKGNKKIIIGICPKCKKNVVTSYTSKSYYCEDYKNCDFFIWKTQCNTFLSPEQINEILTNGETTNYLNFKSSKGNDFKAKIKLVLDGEIYNNKVRYTTFVFENNNTKNENENLNKEQQQNESKDDLPF